MIDGDKHNISYFFRSILPLLLQQPLPASCFIVACHSVLLFPVACQKSQRFGGKTVKSLDFLQICILFVFVFFFDICCLIKR